MTTSTNTPTNRNMILQPSWYNPLDKFFRNDFLALWQGHIPETIPPANIKNETDFYRIELAAPGLKKEDFVIDTDKNIVIISANETSEEPQQEVSYSRREYNYTNFSRRVSLPENADTEKITAKYTNGLLILQIAKKMSGNSTRNAKIRIE